MSTGGTQTFTHGDGFVAESTDYLSNTPSNGTANFEDQMNNLSFYVFVGFMVMFLAYQYISSAMMDQ